MNCCFDCLPQTKFKRFDAAFLKRLVLLIMGDGLTNVNWRCVENNAVRTYQKGFHSWIVAKMLKEISFIYDSVFFLQITILNYTGSESPSIYNFFLSVKVV